MVLNNILILRGTYSSVQSVREELEKLMKNPKTSTLYTKNTTSVIKNIIIDEAIEMNYLYNLKLTFKYKKLNIEEFINLFKAFDLEIIHMCESDKNEIWIVNNERYIKEYQLIPSFAINHILLDYMDYKESSIILDSYVTIKYDLNHKQIVVDNERPTYDEILNLLFEKTIKGRYLIDIIENFVTSYYEKCINSYEELYSINRESSENEVTTPLALFVVTFGIFAIVLFLLKIMGYI